MEPNTIIAPPLYENNLMNGVSIIIPTYNGANHIEECLAYIARLMVPPHIKLEIILVDNNSTDGTAAIAEKAFKILGNPFPFRIVHEKNQGLSFARMCGILHAKNAITIFCDDDNLLATDYVIHAYEFFEKNPGYGIVGGEVLPFERIELPEWFHKYHGMYAICYMDEDFRDRTNYSIVGAGMCIRTDLGQQIFNAKTPILCIGPSGQNEFRCDDGEICRRADLLGEKIGQSKKLRLWHHIDAERLTLAYLEKLKRQGAKDFFILKKYYMAKAVSVSTSFFKFYYGFYCLIKLMIANLFKFTNMKQQARDYLFFITGFSFFSDVYSAGIYQFVKSNPLK